LGLGPHESQRPDVLGPGPPDAEAGVWWAVSDDKPGLVSEAGTLKDLIERIRAIAPELLALNGVQAEACKRKTARWRYM